MALTLRDAQAVQCSELQAACARKLHSTGPQTNVVLGGDLARMSEQLRVGPCLVEHLRRHLARNSLASATRAKTWAANNSFLTLERCTSVVLGTGDGDA